MDTASLAIRARNGDVDAFTTLVTQHQTMVFGYAYATTGNFELAEDAAQQAFITAWRNLGKLQHPERFGSWLRTITRYECLHLIRNQRAVTVPLDLAGHVASAEPSPAQAAEDGEAFERAMTAIGALPDPERVAIVLYSIRDHSQREVARFLDLPVTTVNNRLRSARKRLREGGLFTMTKDALSSHSLPDDFPQRIGNIVRRDGPAVDARFTPENRPPILNEVAIVRSGTGTPVSAQVAQYLDDDLVRCVVLSDPNTVSGGDDSGGTVHDLSQPVSVPMDHAAIASMIDRLPRNRPDAEMLETGIKAIDLFCPIGSGAAIGLVGDMQTGKMVLVEELIHRLPKANPPITLLVFVETTTEVQAIQQLDYRTSSSVEAVYLPVADASHRALADVIANIDGVITLSRDLGKNGLYPAIGPLQTTSRILDSGIASDDHTLVVGEMRALLQSPESQPDRTALLRSYLSQPFHVAEPFTNLAGEDVPLATAIADCRSILEGDWDGQNPDDLRMTGALDAANRSK